MGTSIPQVEDVNNDGHKDIVVSDYMCDIAYYEGNGSDDYSEKKHFLLEDGSTLTYKEDNSSNQMNSQRTYGAVVLHDWNEDGLLDVLFTSIHIPLTVHLNCGTAEEPTFKTGEKILLNNAEIKFKRPSLQVADVNLDGLKDLIFGMDMETGYALNSGTNDEPIFDSLDYFYAGDSVKIEMDKMNREARPIHGEVMTTVCDWNSDGTPDLLVGENCGWTISPPFEKLYLFEGVPDGTENTLEPTIVSNPLYENFTITDKHISFNELGGSVVIVAIYTIQGQKIVEKSIDATNSTFELSSITKGNYILGVVVEGRRFYKAINLQ